MQLTLLLEVSVSSPALSSLIPSSLSFCTVFFFFSTCSKVSRNHLQAKHVSCGVQMTRLSHLQKVTLPLRDSAVLFWPSLEGQCVAKLNVGQETVTMQ